MSDIENPDFGYRFRMAVRESSYRDLTQTELAPIFGVTQTTVSTWMYGRKIPHPVDGIEVCKKLNICLEWLYTGRGPFRPPQERNDPVSELSRFVAHLRPSHIDIVMALAKQLHDLDR